MIAKYKIEGREEGDAMITDCLLLENYLKAKNHVDKHNSGFQRCTNARKYLEAYIGFKICNIEKINTEQLTINF